MKDEKSALTDLATIESQADQPGSTRHPKVSGYKSKLKAHPIADAFPMLPDDQILDIAISIGRNGLRDPITLFEGMILDGRNRDKACEKAGITPTFEEFDPAKDGSPAQFVADKNLKRRDLTSGQKAMAALKLIPFFEAEIKARNGATEAPAGDDKGTHVDTSGEFAQTPPRKTKSGVNKAAGKAARATGTSRSQVERAKSLASKNPKAAADVAAGKTSLNKAITATEMESALKRIEEICGKKLADAVRAGIRIRRKAEVIQFAKLPKEKMLDIQGLIETADWKVKDALLFKAKDLSPAHRIADLHARAAKEGGKHVCEIDGYRHTVERVAKLEVPKAPAKPAAKKAPAKAKKPAAKKPKKGKK